MDLFVKLYDIKDIEENSFIKDKSVIIKRPIAPEKHKITEWVSKNFSQNWASEVDVSISKTPPTCFIALKNGQIIGFACYDSTSKGFFGPIGVLESERKTGVGKALLLKTLKQMYYDGYGYAVIGWAGPVEFFKKTAGAIEIPDSDTSVYKDMIR